MPSVRIDCEDPSISQKARAAVLRLRARVARRPGRWRERMLRRPPPDPPLPVEAQREAA